MNQRTANILSIPAIISLLSAYASGAVYPALNVDFNTMATDARPATMAVPTTAGTVLTKPTDVSLGTPTDMSILVRGRYPDNTGDHVVEFYDNNTAGRSDMNFQAASADTATSGILTFSMNVYVATASYATNGMGFFVNFRNSGNTPIAAFAINLSTGEVKPFYQNGSNFYYGSMTLGTLSLNTEHNIQVVLDLTSQSVTYRIDNVDILTSSTLMNKNISDNVAKISMGTDTAAKGLIYIDNVGTSYEAVPEPAAIGLLGCASAALFLFRRCR